MLPIILSIEFVYAESHLIRNELHKAIDLRLHCPIAVDDGNLRLDVIEGYS